MEQFKTIRNGLIQVWTLADYDYNQDAFLSDYEAHREAKTIYVDDKTLELRMALIELVDDACDVFVEYEPSSDTVTISDIYEDYPPLTFREWLSQYHHLISEVV